MAGSSKITALTSSSLNRGRIVPAISFPRFLHIDPERPLVAIGRQGTKEKMHLLRRIAVVTTAAAMLGAGVSACGGSSSSTGHSIVDKAKDEKTLNIGVKPDQPGLGLQTSAGQYTGFDIDVATYIAKKLGATKINFVPTLSANREAFLEQGKVDMVVATYSITPERQKVVAFAGPYYVAHQDILVRADNTS